MEEKANFTVFSTRGAGILDVSREPRAGGLVLVGNHPSSTHQWPVKQPATFFPISFNNNAKLFKWCQKIK